MVDRAAESSTAVVWRHRWRQEARGPSGGASKRTGERGPSAQGSVRVSVLGQRPNAVQGRGRRVPRRLWHSLLVVCVAESSKAVVCRYRWRQAARGPSGSASKRTGERGPSVQGSVRVSVLGQRPNAVQGRGKRVPRRLWHSIVGRNTCEIDGQRRASRAPGRAEVLYRLPHLLQFLLQLLPHCHVR